MKTRITSAICLAISCMFISTNMQAQQKKSTPIKSIEKVQQMPILEKECTTSMEVQKAATVKMPSYASAKATTYVAPKEDKKKMAAELQKQKLQKEQSIAARKERDKITNAVEKRMAKFYATKTLETKTKSEVKIDKKRLLEQKQKDMAELAKKIEDNLTKKN